MTSRDLPPGIVTSRNRTAPADDSPLVALLAVLTVLGATATWTEAGELRLALPTVEVTEHDSSARALSAEARARLWGAVARHRDALRRALADDVLGARWPGMWGVLPAGGLPPAWRCAVALYTAAAPQAAAVTEGDIPALLEAECHARPILGRAHRTLDALRVPTDGVTS